MHQLVGNSVTDADCSTLQELILQWLPHTVYMSLVAANDMPLEHLATLADQVVERTLPAISSVTFPSTDCNVAIARVESGLDKLAGAVDTPRLTDLPKRVSCHRSRFQLCLRKVVLPETLSLLIPLELRLLH